MEAKQVIVFRKDLLKGEHGIRKGKLAGQVAHASLGALLKCFDIYESTDGGVIYHAECRKGTALDSWLNGIFTKVVSPQMCPWHSQAFRLFYAGHRKSAIELVRIVAPSSEFL